MRTLLKTAAHASMWIPYWNTSRAPHKQQEAQLHPQTAHHPTPRSATTTTPARSMPTDKLPRNLPHHHYALPAYGEYFVDSPSTGITSRHTSSTFNTPIGGGSAGTAASGDTATVDLVFCDPVVFRYLEEDPGVQAIHRNRHLHGYEVYMVEQWVCSRTYACKSIATYTGDPKHRITVSVLRIPRDEARWSTRLRCYFNDVRQAKAKAKDTELGTLMVTNLSNFPSEWVVVLVPGGDVRDHRHAFIVNEDLKKLGCSGRTALSLGPPTDATVARFYQMFRIAGSIEFNTAVVELVRACQLALMAFGLFTEKRWVDGLLCDTTEKSLKDWWAKFGTEYDVEPADGLLGPTTVAGLLGMLLGARTRLNMLSSQVPKDALDIPQMMKAVRNFQQAHRLPEVSGYLDRTTFLKLRKLTMRDGGRSGAGSDIFAVPRAIRSGIADLGSRAVGGSANQVDPKLVETVSLERFIANLSGETCKYLWQGKLKKTSTSMQQQLQSAAASRRNSASVSGEDALNSPAPTAPPSTQGIDPALAVLGAISSAPVSVLALHLPQQLETTPLPSSAPVSKSSTGFSGRDGGSTNNGSGATGVFKSVTGRMKKAGAEFRSSTKHQQIDSRRSVPKDLDLGYHQASSSTPPRTATPPLAVVTAPSSPKLTPQLQPQVGGTGNSNDPLPVYTFPQQQEFSLSSRNPEPGRQQSLPDQPPSPMFNDPALLPRSSSPLPPNCPPSPPRPPLPSLRRPSLPLPPTSHHDSFFPRRLSFSLALDSLTTTTWTLPFSPPTPPSSPPHLPTILFAEHHLSILTSRTHTLSLEADALEKHYNQAEEEVAQTEEGKRRVLRAVEEAEAAVGCARYETAMTKARLADLGDAVKGVAWKVSELESEWEEAGGGRGGKEERKKEGGWLW
ncbi:hypothetical protein EX30DRAFT_393111 [Ascodesmis nigricans]|uniref:Peptidoglycan binding-like domain-containing protein n=1 Tax=Ascodesmis nigricans TaxID=341454 RepID=A0A4S2N3I9_9PEZI|nr:hypothetical protein EX30DRAFT_393111 [Ascodesmis nigricans]